jgi:hypothetical protein
MKEDIITQFEEKSESFIQQYSKKNKINKIFKCFSKKKYKKINIIKK